jgi:hypothetical protein
MAERLRDAIERLQANDAGLTWLKLVLLGACLILSTYHALPA